MENKNIDESTLRDLMKSLPETFPPAGFDDRIMVSVKAHAAKREKTTEIMGLATTILLAITIFFAGFMASYLIRSRDTASDHVSDNLTGLGVAREYTYGQSVDDIYGADRTLFEDAPPAYPESDRSLLYNIAPEDGEPASGLFHDTHSPYSEPIYPSIDTDAPTDIRSMSRYLPYVLLILGLLMGDSLIRKRYFGRRRVRNEDNPE